MYQAVQRSILLMETGKKRFEQTVISSFKHDPYRVADEVS
jgi:hypothetical protein